MLRDWFENRAPGRDETLSRRAEPAYQGLPVPEVLSLSPHRSKGHPGGVGLEGDDRLEEAISKGLDDKDLWKILKHVVESPRGRKYADLVVSGEMEPLTDKPRGAGVGKRHIQKGQRRKGDKPSRARDEAHEDAGYIAYHPGSPSRPYRPKIVAGGRKEGNLWARAEEGIAIDKHGRVIEDTSKKEDALRTKWHKKHTDKGKDTSKTKARAPKE